MRRFGMPQKKGSVMRMAACFAGCVGWNGVFVHTGVCGGGGGWGGGWGGPHVCGGYHGVFIGGVWCA